MMDIYKLFKCKKKIIFYSAVVTGVCCASVCISRYSYSYYMSFSNKGSSNYYNNSLITASDTIVPTTEIDTVHWINWKSLYGGSIYQKLLRLAKSKDRSIRLKAIQSLSEISDLQDYQCNMIAQSSDANMAVGLARAPIINKLFFLSPPFRDLEKGNLKEDILKFLVLLPDVDSNSCIQSLVRHVMLLAAKLREYEEDWDYALEDSFITYHSEQRKRNSFMFDKICLQVFLAHSNIRKHRVFMVEKGILKLLFNILRCHEDDVEYHSLIAQILSNFATEASLKKHLHVTGWVGILATWSKSCSIKVCLPAIKALANMDEDDCLHSIYEDGIYLLYPNCRKSLKNLKADVIFVHGLLGSSFWTWRQNDSMNIVPTSEINDFEKIIETSSYTYCWPKDWLALDVPQFRLISIDYNTGISNWRAICPQEKERDSLDAKAKYFITKLLQSNIGNKPIFWITHSMGGLLVKKILLESSNSNDEKTKLISQNTTGVVFLSVPHKGSEIANMLQYMNYIFQPSVDMLELQKDSSKLLSLHEDFRGYVLKNEVAVLSFGETMKTRLGLKSSLLVPEDSSDPGFGKYYSISSDHLGTSKPESRESELYSNIVKFLHSNAPVYKQMTQNYSQIEYEIFNILCLLL